MGSIHLITLAFLSLKLIVDTLTDVGIAKYQNIASYKISKLNKHITLLSDANVPVGFRAQQRAKYSSIQLKANCIAAQRYLRCYFKLI